MLAGAIFEYRLIWLPRNRIWSQITNISFRRLGTLDLVSPSAPNFYLRTQKRYRAKIHRTYSQGPLESIDTLFNWFKNFKRFNRVSKKSLFWFFQIKINITFGQKIVRNRNKEYCIYIILNIFLEYFFSRCLGYQHFFLRGNTENPYGLKIAV